MRSNADRTSADDHPLCQALEAAIRALDVVDKDIDEGRPPSGDINAYLEKLAVAERAWEAFGPIPAGAFERNADLDVVARDHVKGVLDDLQATENKRRHMNDLADLVEAAVRNGETAAVFGAGDAMETDAPA